jgi:hypothetical protein
MVVEKKEEGERGFRGTTGSGGKMRRRGDVSRFK